MKLETRKAIGLATIIGTFALIVLVGLGVYQVFFRPSTVSSETVLSPFGPVSAYCIHQIRSGSSVNAQTIPTCKPLSQPFQLAALSPTQAQTVNITSIVAFASQVSIPSFQNTFKVPTTPVDPENGVVFVNSAVILTPQNGTNCNPGESCLTTWSDWVLYGYISGMLVSQPSGSSSYDWVMSAGLISLSQPTSQIVSEDIAIPASISSGDVIGNSVIYSGGNWTVAISDQETGTTLALQLTQSNLSPGSQENIVVGGAQGYVSSCAGYPGGATTFTFPNNLGSIPWSPAVNNAIGCGESIGLAQGLVTVNW